MAMGSQAGSRTEEALNSSNGEEVMVGSSSAPHILFASIWIYAIASGLIALALTEIIAAIAPPGSLRLSLQLTTVPVVAGTAGIACQRTLSGLRTFVASRSRK